MRLDTDFAETILRSFINLKNDDRAFLVGIKMRRRSYPHIRIAVGEIETPDQVLIILDAVGVIGIVIENKAQRIAHAGLHHASKLDLRKSAVAAECNVFDRELLAFLDLEHEIDSAVVTAFSLDRLRHHLSVEIAMGAIEIENVHDVVLDEFAR